MLLLFITRIPFLLFISGDDENLIDKISIKISKMFSIVNIINTRTVINVIDDLHVNNNGLQNKYNINLDNNKDKVFQGLCFDINKVINERKSLLVEGEYLDDIFASSENNFKTHLTKELQNLNKVNAY
jgi:hypothetical protein